MHTVQNRGVGRRSGFGDQIPYHTYHIRSPGRLPSGGRNGQRGPSKTTLVNLEHAEAGMKQRVQYRGRDLTTEVEDEVSDEMQSGAKDGARERSGGGGNREGKHDNT